MSSSAYMQGRKKYQRPQAVLFSDNPGTIDNGFYVPLGSEMNSDKNGNYGSGEFLILSDDNRDKLDFKYERIEQRKRMVTGRMRSYHIADKLSLSLSWSMLPSRSFNTVANFHELGVEEGLIGKPGAPTQYTTDGGAGGVDLLDWYENHQGSFWVFLAYDKHNNFGTDTTAYENLNKYNQVVEMFFSDFTYTIVKRGGSNHDYWDVSLTLEEA